MPEIRYLNIEYFFNWILEFFRSLSNPYSDVGFFGSQVYNFIQIFFKFILPIGIILLFIAWIYYHIRIIELRRLELEQTYDRIRKKQEQEYTTKHNRQWEVIEKLFLSKNSGDWRLAIIEADGMLEELIIRLGYPGNNLGERLKNITSGDFPDLQIAWEAHLVRNKIAHEGLAFHLTERDARHVQNLYRRIFENAGII